MELDLIAPNDLTSPHTKHEIIFAGSFTQFLTWIYNLRIDYPTEEIYIGDDDVSGAFRHAKWNPNVVGMHTFMLFGFRFLSTGLTFGGNTCPAQWEIIAICKMLLVMYLWFKQDTVQKVRHLMPKDLIMAPPPSPLEVAAFTPAERYSLNSGVHQAESNI